MVDKKNIVKAGVKPETKTEEPKAEAAVNDPGLAEAIKSAKSKGKVSKQVFAEGIKTSRPVNVYLETTADGPYIWWTTENGKEVGRKSLEEEDQYTSIKTLKGYEFDIPFTPEVADGVKKTAFSKTSYYSKDGVSRRPLTFDEFVKSGIEQAKTE